MRRFPASGARESGRPRPLAILSLLPCILLGFLLGLLLAAAPLAAQEADLRSYLPADVGDLWSFETVPDGDSLAYAISSQERLSTGRIALRREQSNGDQRLQWVDADGLWIASFHHVDGTEVELAEPILLVPSTLTVNGVHEDETATRSLLFADPVGAGNLSIRVQRLPNETVSVPAGTFPDCLVLRTVSVRRSEDGTEATTVRTEWRAVGVGLVRFEETGDADTESVAARLTGATVGDRLVESPPATTPQQR